MTPLLIIIERNSMRRRGAMFGKLRPQIFLAIVVLGILSSAGLYYGMNEIATGCTGGIIALGMKLLDGE